MAKLLFYRVYTLWEVDSMTINLFLNFIRLEYRLPCPVRGNGPPEDTTLWQKIVPNYDSTSYYFIVLILFLYIMQNINRV